MSSSAKLFSQLFIVIVFIKIFDVFKNLVVASFLGVSSGADIYSSLIIIPDSLIVILGLDTIRGVVNSEYAHFYSRGQLKEMWNSFNNLFNILFWISIIVVAFVMLFNSFIVELLLPGFSGDKRLKAISISYIIFPILFFRILSGYFQSVFNSLKSFFFPVVAPVIISVAVVVSVLFPAYNNDLVYNLSFANLIGNISLFVIMIAGLVKIGGELKFKKIEFDPITLKILKASGSILILVICNQLFLFSKNYLASYFGEGAIAALHYSGTITSVIISMIFAIFFTVLISKLSSLYSENKPDVAKELYLQTMASILYAVVPCVSFFVIYGEEILTLVYKRGSFDSSGIEMTLRPFYWDAVALITFVLYIIPSALYLARKDYEKLTKIGSIVYLFGILLNYLLSNYFGFYAISMAGFITTGIYGTLLILNSGKLSVRSRNYSYDFLSILLCGVISLIILFLVKFYIFEKFINFEFANLLIILALNFALLAAVYAASTKIFGVNYVGKLIKIYRNRN